MLGLNDFHAFKSTSGGSSGGGGIGCSTEIIVIGIILFILYLIGKMSG